MADSECLRKAFGQALATLGRELPELVALEGDLADATQSWIFGAAFPERFFNMGIAEQDMFGTAAGLATCGKIPFVSTFATFATMRASEQLRTTICYPNLNVKVVATHAGLSAGATGPTHQATEDLAMTRAIPNLVVLAPADAPTVRQAIPAMARHQGPVYMRLSRDPLPPVHAEGFPFAIGKAVRLREGTDVTLIACGNVVLNAVAAAAALAQGGVSARVLDMHTVKPIDQDEIIRAARETGRIVTLEDHQIMGGLGSAVAEVVTATLPVPVLRLGVPDCFGWVGSQTQLLEKAGLGVAEVVRRVRVFCGKA